MEALEYRADIRSSNAGHLSPTSPTTRAEAESLRSEWRRLSGSSKKFAAKAAIIASIGGLLFGYDVGVVEGALPQLTREMNLSLGQQDLVVATMVAGALAGSVVAGFLTDRLGRWLTIVLTDLTFIVGGVALFSATSPGSVLVGRFIVGTAVAISAVADVSYLAEVAPEAFRGGMVSCNELAISVGMLASFMAGRALKNMHGGWRLMFGFSSVLAVLQLGLMLAFMPRSPRWLMTQKRRAEAESVLLKIRNSQEDVDAEIHQIELSDWDAQGSLRGLLTQWRLPLVVTTTLAVFQQLTGQTNVLNYTVQIFQASGLAAIAAPAVWLGTVKVVLTIIAIAYVDKLGRRPFLLVGASGSTVSLWLLSIGFLTETPVLSFLACCSLVACYSISFGPVTWLITAEMFPAGVRGKALGISQIGSFAGNLIASGFFLRLLDAAGGFVTFFLPKYLQF
eukprot:g3448.t1